MSENNFNATHQITEHEHYHPLGHTASTANKKLLAPSLVVSASFRNGRISSSAAEVLSVTWAKCNWDKNRNLLLKLWWMKCVCLCVCGVFECKC